MKINQFQICRSRRRSAPGTRRQAPWRAGASFTGLRRRSVRRTRPTRGYPPPGCSPREDWTGEGDHPCSLRRRRKNSASARGAADRLTTKNGPDGNCYLARARQIGRRLVWKPRRLAPLILRRSKSFTQLLTVVHFFASLGVQPGCPIWAIISVSRPHRRVSSVCAQRYARFFGAFARQSLGAGAWKFGRARRRADLSSSAF